MSFFLKLRTKIQEQSTAFAHIVWMEFFNMGLILLITSFDPTRYTSLVKGTKYTTYDGFESAWYSQQGIKLCMALFLSSFATNFNECQKMFFAEIARLIDRGFRPNLKKDLEDEDDDEPNTKLRIQNEVQNLYHGPPYQGEKNLSR